VAKHCRELAAADGIIIVHPNWWGQPPAILTGWIDRVVRSGLAYRFREGDGGEGVPEGLLRLRRAVIFNTSDTPAEREERVFGDPLERIWKKCVFDFCGVKKVSRKVFRVVVTSTGAQRAGWLARARALVAKSFPPEG
jgi:putative NADPH-quinone reductase